MIPRIRILNNSEIVGEMQSMNVDRYGIDLMAPKAVSYLVKLNRISSIAANILKQEMLSLGADAALSRNAVTGKDKVTDCLLMGNHSQFNRLFEKLRPQPFRLHEIGQAIEKTLSGYQKESFTIRCGGYRLSTAKKTLLMGILNITPDSFSGDGILKNKSAHSAERIIEKAEQSVREGADIIDIGAESSRPGAAKVSSKEEIRRLSLCLPRLAKKIKIPISVDTYKPEVARYALENGASIINDISGLRLPLMRRIVAQSRAGVIIMHMQGTPRSMQKNPHYESVLDDIITYLDNAMALAFESGIASESIIIDPGIGFGKTLEHNLEIIKHIREFKALGKPIVLGVSRKAFLGKILNAEVDQRIFGTAATISYAIKEGVNIVRVHDIAAMHDVVALSDALVRRRSS